MGFIDFLPLVVVFKTTTTTNINASLYKKNRAYLAILMGFIDFLPLVVVFAHFAHFGGQQSHFKRPLSQKVSTLELWDQLF